jgi:predicted nucleotidyltransferase
MAGMVPVVADAIAKLRRFLEARFGERLREVVLFGLHARGDATQDSDVDLLVVVDDLTEQERRGVFDLAYDVDSTSPEWVGLAPLPYSSAQAADLRSRERLLFRDIEREGVAL